MIVLPSSESNFFDSNQYHSVNDGSGINAIFPSPISGYAVYGTYGPYSLVSGNSIFGYNDLDSRFSSASGYSLRNNFNSFNDYIHYYPKKIDDLDDINDNNKGKNKQLQIPYVSSFKYSIYSFNPYAPRF